jgi:ubiquinone/menaquinone biosynthesis C-methylase UbiE
VFQNTGTLAQARGRTLAYALSVSAPKGHRPLPLAFGAVAETYDRVRPQYFPPLLDRAEDVLQLGPNSSVLDLAAGTGRLTRELAKRFAKVLAVEPDDQMRALIEAGTVLPGRAEAIPVDAASVDAVFVGEAFHWFNPISAIREIARVLRPHGGLAVIYTHWWETEPPVPEAAIAALRAVYEGSLEQRRPPWPSAFEESPFEPLRYENFEEEMTVDAETLLALYSTTSSLAALEDNSRTALLGEVRPHLSGPYRLPIKHELAWTRLS